MKILFILLAYLVGSIPNGYILGRLKGVDITKVGSKNIGATNAGRALGKKFAVIVFLLDMLKGALFVLLFRYQIIPAKYCVLNPMLYGLLASLGHTFPIFLKFKGGKSVSCGCGAAVAYCPWLLIVAAIAFIGSLKLTKMVSVGSIVGAISVFVGSLLIAIFTNEINLYLKGYPLKEAWPYNLWFVIFTLIVVCIIVIKHHGNIKRILNGTERKIGQGKK